MAQEQIHHENETDGYKAFLPVARKIKKIDYDGKWRIVPDMKDPLRRFTLERDIAWATIKVHVGMHSTYKRGYNIDYRDKYYYKPMVVVSGLFATHGEPQTIDLGMRVKPRMAKKVIEAINTIVIPKFYKAIEDATKEWEQSQIKTSIFKQNIAKVNGLTLGEDTYAGKKATLSNCPLYLHVKEDENTVDISGELTYDQLAILAKHNGWGK